MGQKDGKGWVLFGHFLFGIVSSQEKDFYLCSELFTEISDFCREMDLVAGTGPSLRVATSPSAFL